MTVSLRDDTCQLFVKPAGEPKTPKGTSGCHRRPKPPPQKPGLMFECLPCVSMSCTRTDLVYLTRSDSARDNLMVFLFLKGALLRRGVGSTADFSRSVRIEGASTQPRALLGMVNDFCPLPAAAVVRLAVRHRPVFNWDSFFPLEIQTTMTTTTTKQLSGLQICQIEAEAGPRPPFS